MNTLQDVQLTKARKLLLTYLYISMSCCLGFLLVGASMLLNLGMSYFSSGFSYDTQSGSLASLREQDLETIVPFIVFGGCFLAAHVCGLRAAETRDERPANGLYFFFNALLATLAGATTMIAGVVGVSTVMQGIFAPADGPYTPGPSISASIVFGIVWSFLFRNILNMLRVKHSAE